MTELLAAGADKEKVDTHGNTALIATASRGQTETVKELLAAGANKTKANNNGNTALVKATQRGHQEVALLLREDGSTLEGDCLLFYSSDYIIHFKATLSTSTSTQHLSGIFHILPRP